MEILLDFIKISFSQILSNLIGLIYIDNFKYIKRVDILG